MTFSFADRYWSKVRVDSDDKCWEWQAGTANGYGHFRIDGRYQKAHRVSWLMAHGPIPDGLIVRHKCDNPPCVNPAHLELGTHKDNTADRESRGRGNHPTGAANHNTKLDASKVAEIRQGPGWTGISRHFAAKFGITEQYVRNLRSERSRQTEWQY